MGNNSGKVAFEMCVVTADYRGDSLGPGVILRLIDENDQTSPLIELDNIFQNELNYTLARFTIDLQDWAKAFKSVHRIEFWRKNIGVIASDWYVDRVIIRDRRNGLVGEWKYSFFPVHDWIVPDETYLIMDCESLLPQYEPYNQRRNVELARRMSLFHFKQRAKGLPVELDHVPAIEVFSYNSKWDIEGSIQILVEKNKISTDFHSIEPWKDMDSLGKIFEKYRITKPLGLKYWMINNICFGAQRIRGCNPLQINLCTELPRCFISVTDQLKKNFSGWSHEQIIKSGRLFVVDYENMVHLEVKSDRFRSGPIALFLYTDKRQLMPLAIKINAHRDEPVFLPKDDCNLWLQAKLWFNMADAINHMVVQRLLNHIILESIYVSLRRNVSQSHPIFQLLAPHFRDIFVVTNKLKFWFFNRTWLSSTIQLSENGVLQLLARSFKEWNFDRNCNFYQDLNTRGLYHNRILGNYPFREDAILIVTAIQKYCADYVKLVYKDTSEIVNDPELQNWRAEISSPMEEGGLAIKGIPGSEQKIPRHDYYQKDLNDELANERSYNISYGFNTHKEVAKFASGLLYLSIVICGSVVRTPMFDEYGFVANYPLGLRGEPPGYSTSQKDGTIRSNDSNNRLTLERIVSSLPNRNETLDTVLNIRLSQRVPQSVLGKYESDYIFDPEAVTLLNEFKKELVKIGEAITRNNEKRDEHHKYMVLDPQLMSNYPGT